MRFAALPAVMRCTVSLFAGSPRTMAKWPSRSCLALASTSKRSLVGQFDLSGPWQVALIRQDGAVCHEMWSLSQRSCVRISVLPRGY